MKSKVRDSSLLFGLEPVLMTCAYYEVMPLCQSKSVFFTDFMWLSQSCPLRMLFNTIIFVIQVYYLPIVPFYNKSVLPTIVGSLPFFRRIFTKEAIQIVHGHSAFSTLAHEVYQSIKCEESPMTIIHC